MDTNLSPSRCPPRQAHCAAPGSDPGLGGGMPTLTHSEAVERPAGCSHSSAGRPASSTKGRASVADTARPKTLRSRADATTTTPAPGAMGEGSRSRAVPGAGAAGPSALLSRRQPPSRSRACPLEADTGLPPRDCASVPDAGGLRPGDSAPLRPPRPPAPAGPALPATHHSGRLRLASPRLARAL